MNKRDERGFTLFELLAAITITGLLAATGIPHYNEYKEKAYDAVALSTMRDLQTATEAIADRVERTELPGRAPNYGYYKIPGSPGFNFGNIGSTTSTSARMTDYINVTNDKIIAVGGSRGNNRTSSPQKFFYVFHCDGSKFYQFLETRVYDFTSEDYKWVQLFVPYELQESTKDAYGCGSAGGGESL